MKRAKKEEKSPQAAKNSKPGAKKKTKAEFLEGKKIRLVFLACSELYYQVCCTLFALESKTLDIRSYVKKSDVARGN